MRCALRPTIAGSFAEFPTAEVGKRAAALVLRIIQRLGTDQIRPSADNP